MKKFDDLMSIKNEMPWLFNMIQKLRLHISQWYICIFVSIMNCWSSL